MMNRSSIDSRIYVRGNACWTYTICSWGINLVVFVKRALVIEGGAFVPRIGVNRRAPPRTTARSLVRPDLALAHAPGQRIRELRIAQPARSLFTAVRRASSRVHKLAVGPPQYVAAGLGAAGGVQIAATKRPAPPRSATRFRLGSLLALTITLVAGFCAGSASAASNCCGWDTAEAAGEPVRWAGAALRQVFFANWLLAGFP